jgi:hypothetical protein
MRFSVLISWLSSGYRTEIIKATIGAMVAIAITVSIAALGESARTAITDQLLGGGDSLRVRPPSLSVGPIELTGSLLPDRSLNESAIADIGEIHGVHDVLPELWSRFPVSLRGELAGSNMVSDGAMLGVPFRSIEGDLTPDEWSWEPGDVVPVLAPRSLMVAYNGGFAAANGMPRLREQAVHGISFTIIGGRNSQGRLDERRRLQAQVVGLTSYGDALAAIVPIEVIQWLDSELGVDNPGEATSVIARVEPGINPEEVQQLIQQEGWGAEPLGGVAKELSVALKSVEFGVQVGGGILAFSALMLLIQFYGVLLRERNEDLRIMRSMGASKWSLGSALSFEVATATIMAVLVGSAFGLGIANLGADLATSVISDRLGVDLILSPTLPFGFLSLMIVAAPLFVVLGAMPTIRRSLNGSLLTR